MAKNETPPPPSPEQVKKHFQAQEKSVFQKPYTRDPGVTIVTTPGEVSRILDAAQQGETVSAFKLRNTDEILPDPVARASDLLQKAHGGMSGDDFAALVASPLDEQCRLALYGQMSDYQRAQIWQRIHKQAFEEQQAALAEAHRRHQLDQKKTDQLLKAKSLQQRMADAAAKRGKVVDGE